MKQFCMKIDLISLLQQGGNDVTRKGSSHNIYRERAMRFCTPTISIMLRIHAKHAHRVYTRHVYLR